MECISELPWEYLVEDYVALRQNLGLTQTEVGCVTSTKQQAVARVEKYERTPSIETFMKLLLPLGYTLTIAPIDEIKDREIREIMWDHFVTSQNIIFEHKSKDKNTKDRLFRYFEELNNKVEDNDVL